MNLVKWIDATTGGWRTGVKVTDPDGFSVSWLDERKQCHFLVRESCDGALAWVPCAAVERWAMREEWERSG